MNTLKIKDKKNGGGDPPKYISGALTLTLSAIILKLLGFIYKIPLSSLLGDEGMGYFNTAYTVFSVFYLLCTAGVPKGVTMLITEANERGRHQDARKTVSVTLLAFLFFSASITCLFISFSGKIAAFIGSSGVKYTLIAIAPSIIPVALSGALRGYLGAKLKLGAIAVSQIIDGTGKLVFGLIFARWAYLAGYGPQLISAFTILGVSIGAIGGLIYLAIVCRLSRASSPKQQASPVSKSGELLGRLLKISVPITLSSLVMSLCSLIDLAMIMRNLTSLGYTEQQSTAIFGNYTTLAVPMYNFVISLIAPISIAFLPNVTKAFVNSNYDSANELIKSSLSITAIMTAPMVMGVFVFSRDILLFIFPDSNVELGAPLLSLLIPGAAIMSILLLVNSTLEARGRFFAPLISMLFGAASKIAVGLLLLSNENFGIIGAPLGTVISNGVALLVSIIVLNKTGEVKLPIITTHILPYLNAFIAVYIAATVKKGNLNSLSSSASMILTCLLCAFVYAILCILSGVISFKKIKTWHIKQKSTV